MAKNKKLIIALGVALILVVVVVLLRGSSLNYYMTPAEFAKSPSQARTRVAGQIVNNSIKWKQEENALYFTIKDPNENARLAVVYKGIPPENLVNEAKVVVEGVLNGGNFQADTILVRCPENYLPERAVGALARTLKFEGTLYR